MLGPRMAGQGCCWGQMILLASKIASLLCSCWGVLILLPPSSIGGQILLHRRPLLLTMLWSHRRLPPKVLWGQWVALCPVMLWSHFLTVLPSVLRGLNLVLHRAPRITPRYLTKQLLREIRLTPVAIRRDLLKLRRRRLGRGLLRGCGLLRTWKHLMLWQHVVSVLCRHSNRRQLLRNKRRMTLSLLGKGSLLLGNGSLLLGKGSPICRHVISLLHGHLLFLVIIPHEELGIVGQEVVLATECGGHQSVLPFQGQGYWDG